MRRRVVYVAVAAVAALAGAAFAAQVPFSLTALQRSDGSVMIDAMFGGQYVGPIGVPQPAPQGQLGRRPRIVVGANVPADVVVCRELADGYVCKAVGELLPEP